MQDKQVLAWSLNFVQNEGVAYYLSMQESSWFFPSAIHSATQKSIPALNAALDELSDPRTTHSVLAN